MAVVTRRRLTANWRSNDYWSSKVGGCDWNGSAWGVQVVDLWRTNVDEAGQGPANRYNNSCTGMLPNVNDANDGDRFGKTCYAFGIAGDKDYGKVQRFSFRPSQTLGRDASAAHN